MTKRNTKILGRNVQNEPHFKHQNGFKVDFVYTIIENGPRMNEDLYLILFEYDEADPTKIYILQSAEVICNGKLHHSDCDGYVYCDRLGSHYYYTFKITGFSDYTYKFSFQDETYDVSSIKFSSTETCEMKKYINTEGYRPGGRKLGGQVLGYHDACWADGDGKNGYKCDFMELMPLWRVEEWNDSQENRDIKKLTTDDDVLVVAYDYESDGLREERYLITSPNITFSVFTENEYFKENVPINEYGIANLGKLPAGSYYLKLNGEFGDWSDMAKFRSLDIIDVESINIPEDKAPQTTEKMGALHISTGTYYAPGYDYERDKDNDVYGEGSIRISASTLIDVGDMSTTNYEPMYSLIKLRKKGGDWRYIVRNKLGYGGNAFGINSLGTYEFEYYWGNQKKSGEFDVEKIMTKSGGNGVLYGYGIDIDMEPKILTTKTKRVKFTIKEDGFTPCNEGHRLSFSYNSSKLKCYASGWVKNGTITINKSDMTLRDESGRSYFNSFDGFPPGEWTWNYDGLVGYVIISDSDDKLCSSVTYHTPFMIINFGDKDGNPIEGKVDIIKQ